MMSANNLLEVSNLRIAFRVDRKTVAEAVKGVSFVVPRNATAAGYLTVFPCDAAAPAASTLNFSPGRINATTTIVKVVNGDWKME